MIKFSKILTVFFLISIAGTLYAQNQVIVRLKHPPPNQLGIGDLWNLELNNTTGNDLEIYLTGTATEETDGLIVEGRSKVFTLIPGRSNFKYNDFKDADIKYKDNKYKEIILRTGWVPEGNYTICVTAFNKQGEVVGMENCFVQPVVYMGSISLVLPGDGDEINPEEPLIFSWTPLPNANDYTLKIVEIRGNQSPNAAMNENRAFYEKEGIRTTTFQYPASEKKFETGKTYAWMVKSGGVESEVYSFNALSAFKLTDCNGATVNIQKTTNNPCCFTVTINPGTGNAFKAFILEYSGPYIGSINGSTTTLTRTLISQGSVTQNFPASRVIWSSPTPITGNHYLGEFCMSGLPL